jgi:ABC-type spermidine/putrescine transport system permease subunit I
MSLAMPERRLEKLSSSATRHRPWSPERGHALLLLPPLLLLVGFFVIPLADVVLQSFMGPGHPLEQYARIFTQSSSLQVLLYTFQTAATVTLCTLVLSYPVAFVVSRAKGDLGWIERPLKLMSNGVGMQIAMIHIMLPFMVIPLLNTMRGIDGNLLRAAAVLGANPLRQFLSVYLPLSLPGVSAGSILVFISSLGFYITPALLGGQNTMVAVLIEQQASRLLDWPMASALATVLLVVTCLLFLLYERAMRFAGGGKTVGEAS